MDSTKQIGKYIRQNKDKATYAIERTQKFLPKTERTRDIFDYVVPFRMDFTTTKNQHKVILDINITEAPLNLLGCCADCVCPVTERFWGGTTIYPLLYTPTTNSVRVMYNEYFTTDFSLSVQTVTLGFSTVSTDTVKIFYIYKYDDCSTGTP